MPRKIAIQGSKGSFHEIAAKKYFGKQAKHIVYCKTFIDVFKALDNGVADCAIIAIGNNRYGDINHVYDLLINNHLGDNPNKYWISGEVYINIEHCLLGLDKAELDDIQEVYSQAPAIVQCFSFIHNNLRGAKAIETEDTAISAQLIKEWQDESRAAIASRQAAKIYGLKIIAESIQDDKNNLTRFLLIEYGKQTNTTNFSKTSILLRTTHQTGDLGNALKLFAENDINISYLQSIPIPNRPFQFRFYIDLDAGVNDEKLQQAFKGLDELGCQYYMLGSYTKGEVPHIDDRVGVDF